MIPTPYLTFNDDCAEALQTYARIFGAPDPELMMLTPEQAEQFGQAGKDMVMHGALQLGDGWIFASDAVMGDYAPMTGVSVHVTRPTAAAAQSAFDALADGGEVGMPFAATDWAKGFGMVTDRFGIRWMVSTEE